MADDQALPPPQWHVDPHNPNQWRWWNGHEWTDDIAPRTAEPAPQPRQRSRFMRELVGSKQERSAARAERLQARDEFKAHLSEKTARRRGAGGGQQVRYSSISQALATLTTEPFRHPMDEQIEVAGEAYYAKEIRRVFSGRGETLPVSGTELNDLTCVLVPEPWNSHDPNAVAVTIDGQQVGHLPADIAEEYAPPLATIAGKGSLVTGLARVWARDGGTGMVHARVTILVPESGVL